MVTMSRVSGAAARLPEGERKALAVRALTGSESITELADEIGVSPKFVYTQTHRAGAALDAAFATAANDCARKEAVRSQALARDVQTLSQWLGHDVLSLAGPKVAVRQELFNFVAAELQQREREDVRRIRPMRVAPHNQRRGSVSTVFG